jgi:small-conductance mechanosensitive channel
MILRFCCALLILVPLPVAGSNQTTRDSLPTFQILKVDMTVAAPVVLAQDTLFFLQAGVRGFSADQRAERVSRKITEMLAESGVSLDSLVVVESEVSSDIVVQDYLILGVFDIDASLKGTARRDLAQQYMGSIRVAVERYREDRSKSTLFWGLIFSVAATIVLVFAVRVLSRGVRWLETLLGTRVHGITIQDHEVVRAEWMRAVLHVPLKLGKWFLIAVFFYVYLEFVLARFVWTRTVAASLLNLTLDPLRIIGSSIWEYLPSFFFLIVLAILTTYLLKFLRFIFAEIEKGRLSLPGFYPDWATPTYKLVRILVVAFALVMAFPYIPGSDSSAFKGVSIFLGVLFSLGSTSAVANIVAGVILTYMRSFTIGDMVSIQETIGMVISHGLLVTRVRTLKNVEVTFPNGTVLGTHVINYSAQAKEGRLILPTRVTIGYDAPWRQVHELLRMAADRTAEVLKDPEPYVLQNSLDDFYVTYELNVFTRVPERMDRIYSELHRNIQDTFNAYGVQIMSPNYMMDRAKPTVVPKKKWYQPPARKPDIPGADM